MAYRQSIKNQNRTSHSRTTRKTGTPENQTRLTLHPMHQLQRTVGNRAVQRLVESADQPAQQESFGSYHGEGFDETAGFEEQLAQRRGLGGPLPEDARTYMESHLGIDLSPVRIHTDGQADRLADAVNATAFTTGTDIFFRDGAYSPHMSDGMRLLAHEVTHVLQQSAGPVAGTPMEGSGVSVSDPSDMFEREADSVADKVMGDAKGSGNPIESASSPSSGNSVQREENSESEDESWKSLASVALAAGSALGGGMITEPLSAVLGVSEMGEHPITGTAEAITGTLGLAADLGGFELLGAEGAGAMGMGELSAAAGAGELGTLGLAGPAAAVAGAGLGGYALGSYIAENTGVDEAIGDEMFDVLGPGPGLWLADTFGL